MTILPIAKPIITSYPKYANLIAILQQHPSYKNWLYLNHIQLLGVFNQGAFWIDFYQPLSRFHYPLIEREAIRKETLLINGIPILPLICNSIDRQGYVYLNIDTYYLSAYHNSGKEHYPHDMLIYGYDAQARVMYIADFFQSAYEFAEASFDEVEQAFHSPHISTYPEFVDIQLLRVLPEARMGFDQAYCAKLIRDYVKARNSSHRLALIEAPLDESVFYFGSDIYRPLLAYMESTFPNYEVLRALHALSDHKKLMLERALFLVKTGVLDGELCGTLLEQLAGVKEQALRIRNACLKSMVRQEKDTTTLRTMLKTLKECELRALAELASLLEPSGEEGLCAQI